MQKNWRVSRAPPEPIFARPASERMQDSLGRREIFSAVVSRSFRIPQNSVRLLLNFASRKTLRPSNRRQASQ